MKKTPITYQHLGLFVGGLIAIVLAVCLIGGTVYFGLVVK